MTAMNSCLLLANVQGKELSLTAQWKVNAGSNQRHCRTLDLVFKWSPRTYATEPDPCISTSTGRNDESGPPHLDGGKPWSEFVIDSLQRTEWQVSPDDGVAMKFILADREGFCTRSDFLERRMEGYRALVVARSFLQPRHHINRAAISDDDRPDASILFSILSDAVGGLIVSNIDALDEVEVELDNRLSYLWIAPSCPPLTRIAWVRGRYNIDHSKRIWDSAVALGIAVVILDNEGHWLQDARWNHLREDFIPTNLDPDAGLADRLVDAIRRYEKPIHGITTSSNKRLVSVAKACETLGLRTSPAQSFIIAADKCITREMEPSSDVTSLRVQNVQDLRDRLSSNRFPPIPYPMVVKPCIGWASECISKVHTETELLRAVEKASERHRLSPIRRTDVMIESYVEGPEIDANIVLLAGLRRQ
ncbi:unnamed protein product [Periconia digitata]|uniref:BL00235/CARNS1 N-terminal domain-containing protein n=1 Tax=Periconia digitata TaxID=1303443 RepID=A0A9W4UX88_9PLEO|nr:unnamed protein product [Periconia digitata]